MDEEYEREKERRLQELRELDQRQMEKVRSSMQQALKDKATAELECEALKKQIEEWGIKETNNQQQLESAIRMKLDLENSVGALKTELAGLRQELYQNLIRYYSSNREKDKAVKKLEEYVGDLSSKLKYRIGQLEKHGLYHRKELEEQLKLNESIRAETEKKHRSVLYAKEEELRKQKRDAEELLQQQLSDLTALYQNKDVDLMKQTKSYEMENRRLLDENKRLMSQVTSLKEFNLNTEHKLNGELVQLRIRVKERYYECDNLRKQLEFEKAYRREYKDRIRAVIEQRYHDRSDFDETKRRNREYLRQLKQTMEERLEDYTKYAEKQNKNLQKELKELRQDNRYLSELCTILKAEKKQLEEELKKELSYEAERTVQQKEQISKYTIKLQRQLYRKQKELDEALKEHNQTKQKLDKVLLKFDEILGKRTEVEKENKMLLSYIVFWRDKNKGTKRTAEQAPEMDDLKSYQSEFLADRKEVENLKRDVETYKALIKEMEKDITMAVEKLDAKNKYIAELEEKNQGLAQLLGRLEGRPNNGQPAQLFKRMSNDSIFSLPKYDDFYRLLDLSGRPL